MSDGWGWLGLDAPEEVLEAQAEEEAMADCYTDEIGGHHGSGMGWAPDGQWCGECCKSSCKGCKIWEAKKWEIAKGLNERSSV